MNLLEVKMENRLSEYVNQIIRGDALEIMSQIPDDSVDVTFADPPFNLKKSYEQYEDDKETRDYLDWCKQWLNEMVRITKPTGSIFVHNIPKWLTYYSCYLNEIAYFKHWIAWDAMGAPLGKTILPNHYGILWYVKSRNFKFYDIRAPHRYCRECNALLKDYGGKKHLIHPFGTLVSDVWTDIYRIRHSKRRDEHPCQLPVHLLERLILMTTDVGDTVLDPFIGTGTFAIAAKRLGRKYIGIDIDDKYVAISREKLEDISPTQINGAFISIFLGKIVTVRDSDYEKVKPFLKTRDLKINSGKSKQLTLPNIAKKVETGVCKPSIGSGVDDNLFKEILRARSKQELIQQVRLLEKRSSYTPKEPPNTIQKRSKKSSDAKKT
jgi:site-specific DNA-methyltransferase (adenine-specific)